MLWLTVAAILRGRLTFVKAFSAFSAHRRERECRTAEDGGSLNSRPLRERLGYFAAVAPGGLGTLWPGQSVQSCWAWIPYFNAGIAPVVTCVPSFQALSSSTVRYATLAVTSAQRFLRSALPSGLLDTAISDRRGKLREAGNSQRDIGRDCDDPGTLQKSPPDV